MKIENVFPAGAEPGTSGKKNDSLQQYGLRGVVLKHFHCSIQYFRETAWLWDFPVVLNSEQGLFSDTTLQFWRHLRNGIAINRKNIAELRMAHLEEGDL